MVKKILGFIVFSIFLLGNSYSEKPKWVDFENRKLLFPESTYFIGFSSDKYNEEFSEEEFLDQLSKYATQLLVQSIHVKIKSISTVNIENINGKTLEQFKHSSASFSNVNIAGLHFQTYFDERKKIGYALAYARKSELARLYESELENNLRKVESKIQSSKDLVGDSRNNEAIKLLFECLPIFRDLEESQSIMVAMGITQPDALKIDQISQLQNYVNSSIYQLQNYQNTSLDDAAFFIALGLKLQTNEMKDRILLNPFTYQNTEMSSDFSNWLLNSLQNKLTTEGGYLIAQNTKLSRSMNPPVKPKYEIKGTYWDEADGIKITANLRDNEDNTTLASVESKVDKSWMEKNNIQFKPYNYNEAFKQLETFSKNEFNNSGLLIDIWTNRGNENLLFTEGDTLQLFIRSNKPCYVRCIYYQADGTKVLLLDNYYIDERKVNQIYELPYLFKCTEPFGAEILQMNAQSSPFRPLKTQPRGGYNFILDDLQKIVSNVRGFQPMQNEDAKAEKRLVITTIN